MKIVKEPSVMIAVPCMDMMHSHFVQSLIRLKKPSRCEVKFCINSLVYTARNNLIKEAIKEHYDYVLFLDSDMTFNYDVLYKLLNRHADVVTGLYYQRKAPHLPVILDSVTDDGKTATYMKKLPDKDYFEVAAFGTGICLVKTQVFIDCVQYTGGCFEPIGAVGEDISFCIRAKNVGYKLYCDKTVKANHLGIYEYSEKDYEGM